MPLTRRSFLKYSASAAGAIALSSGGCNAAAQASSPVLVNHLGFTKVSPKFVLKAGSNADAKFSIVDAAGKNIHGGAMEIVRGDFGSYARGDFSSFAHGGSFKVRVGEQESESFTIGDDVYDSAIQKSIGYFAKQRCGDSKSGYHAPCHLDDGKRRDNGKHQDVTGGWHDACDLRKWVSATIYGMVGLSRMLDFLPSAPIVDELRWGNKYFLSMQEADGYLMDYCGGDDGNNWTDNKIGNADDRAIHVEPCELPAQFQFVASQAALARHVRDADAKYADACIDAANRCLKWCTEKRSPGAALSVSAGLLAFVQMHRATKDNSFRDLAAEYAKRLIALQVGNGIEPNSEVRGFFLFAPDRLEPLREIAHGNLPLLGLCEILAQFGDHPDAPAWHRALELHTQFLIEMSQHSAFGIIPYGLFAKKDPGGNRRVGPYWYRWFMKTRGDVNGENSDWWVGINANLASNGVGMLKASSMLKEPKLKELAAQQLDWILGVNPFNASTVSDVGRNQPRLYRTNAFSPNTPIIPGGVMNGIGGNANDDPSLDSGSYNTCEYWTPMVAYVMWLMAELRLIAAS